jgi:hypothetical protein
MDDKNLQRAGYMRIPGHVVLEEEMNHKRAMGLVIKNTNTPSHNV